MRERTWKAAAWGILTVLSVAIGLGMGLLTIWYGNERYEAGYEAAMERTAPVKDWQGVALNCIEELEECRNIEQ